MNAMNVGKMLMSVCFWSSKESNERNKVWCHVIRINMKLIEIREHNCFDESLSLAKVLCYKYRSLDLEIWNLMKQVLHPAGENGYYFRLKDPFGSVWKLHRLAQRPTPPPLESPPLELLSNIKPDFLCPAVEPPVRYLFRNFLCFKSSLCKSGGWWKSINILYRCIAISRLACIQNLFANNRMD